MAKRDFTAKVAPQTKPGDSGEPVRAGHSAALRWALALAMSAASFLVYVRVLDAEFTYLDDRVYVTENAMVQKGLTWEGTKWAFTTTHASNWHPLTWLSHMLDWSLYGPDAGRHHLTSIILHALNVMLLFHLMIRMTGAIWASAFVAGAFGLHPTHVESVAWVAERKDVLSTFFGLLTLIAYVRYVEAGRSSRFAIVVVLFALSLCAKPMMVTLPFVFLLLDYWPLRRIGFASLESPTGRAANFSSRGFSEGVESGPRSATWSWLVVEKIPLLLLAAASSVVTVYAQRAGGAMMTETMLSVPARISNAIVSYSKYMWMTVWPTGLAVYYPHPLKPHPATLVAASSAVLIVISVLVFAFRRRHPYLLVGWLWFLGTLVPVIGLVQVGGQALADRYTYITTIGLFILVAWAFPATNPPRYVLTKGGGTFKLAVGVLVLLVLGACTWVQAGYWRNSITLFQRALDVVPDNPQAHIFMANTLIRQGKLAEAVPHFAEAVRIVPNEPYNLTDYGHALLDNGQVDEAAKQLEAALRLLPDFADAHYFLGVARLKQGRHADAVRHLETAMARNPQLQGARLHLGSAYAAQGQWAAAITAFQKWLEIDPTSLEALVKLAQVYHAMGNAPAALDTLQNAIDAHPKNPYPLAMKAQISAWGGQAQAAIRLYERALQIDPRYVEAANNLAQILATHPDEKIRDGARAVELARRAAALGDYNDPATLDTLAAAFAEAGEFQKAVETVDSAIGLAGQAGSQTFLDHLEQRRRLYVSGKPARAE